MSSARRTLRPYTVSAKLVSDTKSPTSTNLIFLASRLLGLQGQVDLTHSPLISTFDNVLEPSHLCLEPVNFTRQMVDQWQEIAQFDRLRWHLAGLVSQRSSGSTFLYFLLDHVDSTHLLVQVGFEAEDVVLQRFYQRLEGYGKRTRARSSV